MKHYTYIIQSKTENKRYIGVRSCECAPIDDNNYWSSSKYLPDNVKETHVKIILKVFETRELAINHEILLHDKNNVSESSSYYNRSKQTSLGFDTSGTTLTLEHKKKCSIALKGKTHTEKTKAIISKKLTGRVISDETRKRCSEAQKKYAKSEGYKNPMAGVHRSKEYRAKMSKTKKLNKSAVGVKNPNFKPWFITKDNVTHLYYDITMEDKSIIDGFNHSYYQGILTRSRGVKENKNGYIIGKIPID